MQVVYGTCSISNATLRSIRLVLPRETLSKLSYNSINAVDTLTHQFVLVHVHFLAFSAELDGQGTLQCTPPQDYTA